MDNQLDDDHERFVALMHLSCTLPFKDIINGKLITTIGNSESIDVGGVTMVVINSVVSYLPNYKWIHPFTGKEECYLTKVGSEDKEIYFLNPNKFMQCNNLQGFRNLGNNYIIIYRC